METLSMSESIVRITLKFIILFAKLSRFSWSISNVTVTSLVALGGRTKSLSSLSTRTSTTLKKSSGSVFLSISARINCSEVG